jgi:hypothetical protein
MKFEIYTDIEQEIANLSEKYEVINIAVDRGTYIANGILTHNKVSCTSSYNTTTTQTNTVYVNYGYGNSNLPIIATILSTPVVRDCSYSYITVKNTDTGQETNFNGGSITVTMPTPSVAGISSKTVQWTFYNTTVFQSTSTQFSFTISAQDSSGRTSTNSATKTSSLIVSSCLTPETLIEKYDGQCVYLKDIEVGDELLSIDFNKMEYIKSIVTHKSKMFVDRLYKINDGMITGTKDHRHIVKRKNDWIETTSENLQIGDTYLTKDFQTIKILKIDILK